MAPHLLLPTIVLLSAALLPEGSRPPVFALPDGAGKTVSLRAFLGPRRVVLLFGPAAAFLKTAEAERARFEDRGLTVLAIPPPGAAPMTPAMVGPVHVLRDGGGRVAREYGAAGGAAFYLIGKDGHIALARHASPTTAELFGLIDAMPMRRREMRERGR